jgi:hypothetical protein
MIEPVWCLSESGFEEAARPVSVVEESLMSISDLSLAPASEVATLLPWSGAGYS